MEKRMRTWTLRARYSKTMQQAKALVVGQECPTYLYSFTSHPLR